MTRNQPPKKATKKPDIELVPDAWPRFEKFIKEAAKAGPQHRSGKNPAPPSKRPAPAK
jgi:hypothetical protein